MQNSEHKSRDADTIRPYISPLVGGAGSLAGAALEFVVLPAGGILAATLGLAGAAAGVWLQDGILPERIIDLQEKGVLPKFTARVWRQVRSQAERKLQFDFDNSAIASSSNLRLCRAYARQAMADAGLLQDNDERIPGDRMIDMLALREGSFLGHIQEEDIRILGEHGSLSVSCTAAPVAFIGIIRRLVTDYGSRFGLNLDIRFKYPYGLDQIKDLNTEDRFDFVLAVDAPFFMAGRSRSRRYRLLFPVHWDANFAVRRKGSRAITTEILFCPESSAHEAARVQPKGQAQRRTHVPFSDLAKLVRELDEGQSILTWDPIASTLAQHPDLERDFGTEYRAWRSLYCHRKHRRNRDLLRAFCNLFVAAWNRYCWHREEVGKALLDDRRFLLYFASAALNERQERLTKLLHRTPPHYEPSSLAR